MSDAAPGPARGAFFWMDALRFGAATAVVMEHARDLLFLTRAEVGVTSAAWQGFYFVTGFGHEAVMIFFVLSGFWITSAIDRRTGQRGFWGHYLIDRLSRLMLVVAPALLLGGLLDLVSASLHSPYVEGQSGALTLQQDVTSRLGLTVLAGNLLFLQSILVPTFGTNGPLWSLAYEFWYYLWYPALLFALRDRRPGLALGSLAVAVLAPHMLEGFVVWLMGSALYHLDKKVVGRTPRFSNLTRAAVLAGAGTLLCAVLAASRLQYLPQGGDMAIGGAFALFLWALLRCDPLPQTWAGPFARFGANASFSLYVLHLPVVVLLATVVPPGARTAPDLARLALFAGTVIAAIGLAQGFSRLTEAKTGRVRRRIKAAFPSVARSRETA